MTDPQISALQDSPPFDGPEPPVWTGDEASYWDESQDGEEPWVDPTVTLEQFVASRDESSGQPLITSDHGTILPAAGLALFVSRPSAGKTTKAVDLLLHAAAGRDYLERLSFPRPLRILVIQNEGPRDAFIDKIEHKLANWQPQKGETAEPIRIWNEPARWGLIRLLPTDSELRDRLRRVVEHHKIDLVVSDTLTRFGMRGNGTPEETREFMVLLTEAGLGRDLAFLLLHHPRVRSDTGEDELERIAGAWPAHADAILSLQKLAGNRARLAWPKTRWTRAAVPTSILAFDPATQSFSHVSDAGGEERDLTAELAEVMRDGEWHTLSGLRASKAKGGIGARDDAVREALASLFFEQETGEKIGRQKGIVYYRLKEPPPDGRGSGGT